MRKILVMNLIAIWAMLVVIGYLVYQLARPTTSPPIATRAPYVVEPVAPRAYPAWEPIATRAPSVLIR